MTIQTINIGTSANDRTGDSLRTAFTKINANFTELYTALGLDELPLNLGAFTFTGSTISTTDSSSVTIDQAVTVTSDLTVGGDLLPTVAQGSDLGSAAKPWRSLYVSSSTIYFGSVPVTVDGQGNLLVDGAAVADAGTAAWDNITGKPTFAAVATSGSYADLSNRPAVPADINDLTDTGNLLFDGDYGSLTNQPVIPADVSDLTDTGNLLGVGAADSLTSNDDINITINNDDSSSYVWNFGETGDLTFPDSTVQTTAYPGPQTTLDGDVTGSVFSDGSTLLVDGVNGVIPGTLTGSWNNPGNGFNVTGSEFNVSTESTNFIVSDSGINFGNTVDGENISLLVGNGGISLSGSGSAAIALSGAVTVATGAVSWAVNGTVTLASKDLSWAVNGLVNLAADNINIGPGGVDADLTGSVFADNSTLLVDGVDGKIVGDVETARLRTSESEIALGSGAGTTNQGGFSVAIGANVGYSNQGAFSVALGTNAGENDQNAFGIAIGANAGQTSQNTFTVAIGANAGQTNQDSNSVAIGVNAGQTTQDSYAVAIGVNAGNDTQGSYAIAIGVNAGQLNQGTDAIAIGYLAGQTNQGDRAVAIGEQAGQTSQDVEAVAIGYLAGETSQGTRSVAIGRGAGQTSQNVVAVAVGDLAGHISQGNSAVAVGPYAGETSQGGSAVAIGRQAGNSNQGANSIAIGDLAGFSNQAANSIVINAAGGTLNNTVANTFVVKPIRAAAGTSILQYDASTGEITHTNDIYSDQQISITVSGEDSTSKTWYFGNDGDLTAPGDIKTGLLNTGGRFVQDCADGVTSMRWINVEEGDPTTQILRVYTGETGDERIERAQLLLNWSGESDEYSGFTIKSFDNTDPENETEHDWLFQGDGDLSLPGGGLLGQVWGDGIDTELTLKSPPGEGDSGYVALGSANEQNYVEVSNTGVVLAVKFGQAGFKTWEFDIAGDLLLPGKLKLTQGGVQEYFQAKADATGVVDHDCSLGQVFYHTSPDANWTANFTNLDLGTSASTNLVLVVEQGATPYYPSAVQIGGFAQTIKWLGNVTPTPSANKTEIATFTIFNNAGTFTVLGSYSTYG